jgi:hypothetical protein
VQMGDYWRRTGIGIYRPHLLQRVGPMQSLVDVEIFLQKGRRRQIIVVGNCRRRAAPGLDRESGEMGWRVADLVAPTKVPPSNRRRQGAIDRRREDLLLKLDKRHVDVGGGDAGSGECRIRVHVFRDIRPRQRRLIYLGRSVWGASDSPAADRSSDEIAAAARRKPINSFA